MALLVSVDALHRPREGPACKAMQGWRDAAHVAHQLHVPFDNCTQAVCEDNQEQEQHLRATVGKHWGEAEGIGATPRKPEHKRKRSADEEEEGGGGLRDDDHGPAQPPQRYGQGGGGSAAGGARGAGAALPYAAEAGEMEGDDSSGGGSEDGLGDGGSSSDGQGDEDEEEGEGEGSEAEDGEEESVVSFFGGLVTMATHTSGRVMLEGPSLVHIRPMLRRILRFRRARRQPLRPRWRSSWALDPEECDFLEQVLVNRERVLREGGSDLVPIPQGVQVPTRFRPRDATGTPLRGPYISRNGMPHNRGRQFFSNFRNGDPTGFLWADGTAPFGPEARDRVGEWFFGGGWDV